MFNKYHKSQEGTNTKNEIESDKEDELLEDE